MPTMALNEPVSQEHPSEGALILSAFRKVATALGLTLQQQATILGVSRATASSWKTSPGNDTDKLDRMALFIGIYDLACQAFPGERGGEGWLHRSNTAPIFGGEAPLALILQGRFESLYRTHDHLQALVRIW